MQTDDPPFLPVGTEISAKFKGAFCEARVKKIQKFVKCKIVLKEAPFGTAVVDLDQVLKGEPKAGAGVEVLLATTAGTAASTAKTPATGVQACVQSVKDSSIYTVVFDDGDERVLRRSQLCRQSGKHFHDQENLDTMPLTNPELFGNPVVLRSQLVVAAATLPPSSPAPSSTASSSTASQRRKRKTAKERAKRTRITTRSGRTSALAGDAEESSAEQTSSEEEDDDETAAPDEPATSSATAVSAAADEKKTSDDEDELTPSTSAVGGGASKQRRGATSARASLLSPPSVGTVVCVVTDEPPPPSTSMPAGKDLLNRRPKWYPALVVNPKASKLTVGKNEVLVRSFKDGKFAAVTLVRLSAFDATVTTTKTTAGQSSASSRPAVDRARLFLDRGHLPAHWDRPLLLQDDSAPVGAVVAGLSGAVLAGSSVAAAAGMVGTSSGGDESSADDTAVETVSEMKKKPAKNTPTTDDASDEDSTSAENKDRFVAQLYKFQDERGTPINKVPVLSGRDVDLYGLYKIVMKMGGYNRVTNTAGWRLVLEKLKLVGRAGATSMTVKNCYARYLFHFELLNRQLGWRLDEKAGKRDRSLARGGCIAAMRRKTKAEWSPLASKERRSTPTPSSVVGAVAEQKEEKASSSDSSRGRSSAKPRSSPAAPPLPGVVSPAPPVADERCAAMTSSVVLDAVSEVEDKASSSDCSRGRSSVKPRSSPAAPPLPDVILHAPPVADV